MRPHAFTHLVNESFKRDDVKKCSRAHADTNTDFSVSTSLTPLLSEWKFHICLLLVPSFVLWLLGILSLWASPAAANCRIFPTQMSLFQAGARQKHFLQASQEAWRGISFVLNTANVPVARVSECSAAQKQQAGRPTWKLHFKGSFRNKHPFKNVPEMFGFFFLVSRDFYPDHQQSQ